jgi:UDPglucose 6-dehydrogenase
LTGKQFAVWGLAFKPETDDMREAPSITIINELTAAGAKVVAYDDKAEAEAREHYLKGNENVKYVDSKYAAVRDADALLLITEWNEFRSPDFEEIAKNQYDPDMTGKYGFELYQIGF